MTVIYKKGNILNTKCNIICQQVNCKGVMGAGLALQIRRKSGQLFIKIINSIVIALISIIIY